MSELSRYVDELFSKYQTSRQTEDLKAEILGNLEAKKADLIASGYEESEAVRVAEEGITSVDFLIGGNKRVYYNRLKLEFVQRSLIAVITGWILTIPLLMLRVGLAANGILFLAVVTVGLYYFFLYRKQLHGEKSMDETKQMDAVECRKRKRIVWILWSIFAAVSLLANTALHFGSNLWFSRKISVDGPYALAGLLVSYLVPMLTVLIPIIAGMPASLISKYEVGENNEKQE